MTAMGPALISWSIGIAVLGLWLVVMRLRRGSRLARLRLAALARLNWSELAQLLQRAQVRGGALLDHSSEQRSGSASYDFIFDRDGRRELLACRHGRDTQITARMIDDLAAARVPAAARHAVLATTGKVSRNVAEHARQAGIELLFGRALWDFLAPVLPSELQRESELLVQREYNARALTAAAIAIGGGVALNFTLRSASSDSNVLPDSAPIVAPATTPQPHPAAAQQTTEADQAMAREQAMESLRASALTALRALPEVANAAWPSQSTALVVLKPNVGGLTDAMADKACAALSHLADLGDVRIQFTNTGNKPGEQNVRWRQCRTGTPARPPVAGSTESAPPG